VPSNATRTLPVPVAAEARGVRCALRRRPKRSRPDPMMMTLMMMMMPIVMMLMMRTPRYHPRPRHVALRVPHIDGCRVVTIVTAPSSHHATPFHGAGEPPRRLRPPVAALCVGWVWSSRRRGFPPRASTTGASLRSRDPARPVTTSAIARDAAALRPAHATPDVATAPDGSSGQARHSLIGRRHEGKQHRLSCHVPPQQLTSDLAPNTNKTPEALLHHHHHLVLQLTTIGSIAPAPTAIPIR